MQHFVLRSMTRLTIGVMIGYGMLVSNAVHADMILRDTEVRADAKPGAKSSLVSNVVSETDDVVMNTLGMIDLCYRFGGNTPESGLDCSGFIRCVFNDTFGFLLSRYAVEMSHVGTGVDTAELYPGDLVFFDTMRHAFSHIGIYIGDNKFVCAPSTGNKIRVDDMTASYRVTHYSGARHIGGSSGTTIKDGTDNFVEQLRRIDPNTTGKPLAMYGG